MIRFALLLVAFVLVACGPDPAGAGATPLEASIVVMGERISDPSDPEDLPHVEQYPACMAVALGPDRVVTSDHCEAGVVDMRHVLVDYVRWNTTTSGNVLADTLTVVGEVRTLKPRLPLEAWIGGVAAAGPGAAEVVVLRGSNMVALPVLLDGDMFAGMVPHGDSGAGVFQSGKLVGPVQACNSTDGVSCDLDGGRFSGP